jgi:hypothetical protein
MRLHRCYSLEGERGEEATHLVPDALALDDVGECLGDGGALCGSGGRRGEYGSGKGKEEEEEEEEEEEDECGKREGGGT